MANRTLLQLVQEFYKRQGLGGVPTAVTSSTDDTLLQIWGLLNEGIEEMATLPFNDLQQDVTFYHLNRSNYEAMNFNLDLPDFNGLRVGTFFDQSTRLPVAGPIGQRQWAEMINMQVTAATFNYRLAAGRLYIYPVPATPTTYPFYWQYQSLYGVIGSSGGIVGTGGTKLWYDADDDVPRIPYQIVLQDLRWRYKKEKGMEFSAELDLRDRMIATYQNTQGASPDLDMGDLQPGENNMAGPGLLIPAGTWPL